MKNLLLSAGAIALFAASSTGAIAQDYGHDRGRGEQSQHGQHRGWGRDQGANHRWSRGEQMGYSDWNSASRVDYRRNHLSRPPRGYEWRQQNGQYILGAVATGMIASIIMNSGR